MAVSVIGCYGERNERMGYLADFYGILPPDGGCHQGACGSQGGCGGWGTLKSRFPEDLAPMADELIE